MLTLYIVAGILLVIVLVLSVPVDLVFDLRTDGEGKSVLRAEWLFGLVGKGLLPREGQVKKVRRPKKPEKAKKRDFRYFLAVLRAKGVLAGIFKLSRRMVGGLRVRQLDADLRLGLDDPADTGVIYAVLWPAFILRRQFRTAKLRMEPVFTAPTFEATLQGEVRVFLAEMMVHVFRFVFSPAGMRLLRLMAVLRWKRKN